MEARLRAVEAEAGGLLRALASPPQEGGASELLSELRALDEAEAEHRRLRALASSPLGLLRAARQRVERGALSAQAAVR